MKKRILSLVISAGVISSLTACGSNGSQAIVKTDAGNITKDELYDAMKEKVGEQALQELLFNKILSDKYKVTDKELDEKVAAIKDQLGSNFQMALSQYGLKDEKDLRESLKTSILQEKAAVKDIKVTDAEVKKYYDDFKPQIKARHILVADENTANEVKAKLDKGEKFEDLAKQYSTDTASAQNGGDLGWFGAGAMVKEFEDAAYALNVNEISGPVKSEHGFHIIQVTDKKKKDTFEKMKKQMTYDLKVSKITSESIQKAMERELKDADVNVTDKDLKGAVELKQS
ncbi:peptidylprolyl isomerase [Bacillus sp. 03113]|uniref:peptidylprolyl isomerase n=1 Tax=Bacillus sp. 03113 TaxID=2578211 RepID=UPI00114483DB|nr:peptidylprolyl isomerase [Bacillus sp. 03113]